MQVLEGTIISVAMKNTIVVEVHFTVRHPKYKKIIKRTTKLHVHSEDPELKIGDQVKIIPSKPFSKTVHFQVQKK